MTGVAAGHGRPWCRFCASATSLFRLSGKTTRLLRPRGAIQTVQHAETRRIDASGPREPVRLSRHDVLPADLAIAPPAPTGARCMCPDAAAAVDALLPIVPVGWPCGGISCTVLADLPARKTRGSSPRMPRPNGHQTVHQF